MDAQKELDVLYTMVSKIVKKEMQNRSNYLPFLLPGEIVSVSGSFASVTINGSTTATPNIPINPAITVVASDHVWVLKVNFQDADKMVLCKRPI